MTLILPFSDIFTGLSDMSGHLLELYRMRRDGTFFEQQRYLSELREGEAAKSHERMLELDATRGLRAGAEAEEQQDRAFRQQVLSAGLEIAVSREMRRENVEFENSPFRFDLARTRALIEDKSNNGSRPVILVAPFYQDHLSGDANDNGPYLFKVAIRRTWLGKPWNEDAGILDGILSRPLRNADTDLMSIQNALADLPIILIYGDLQCEERAWASINAWNLAPDSRRPTINVNLPEMKLPDVTSRTHASRLSFEDGLSDRISLIAGTMAEWFHVVHFGRKPRLHTLVDDTFDYGRRYLALATIAAFEIAVSRSTVSAFEAQVCQASVYGEIGMGAVAKDVAESAFREIADAGDPVSRANLRVLEDTLARYGNPELAAATHEMLEEMARSEIRTFLGIGV